MDDIAKYIINLEERLDRRIEMKDELRRIGWDAQFSNSLRPLDANGFPSVGARGCFESHLVTLRRGMDSKKHVLVMEDDLNFAPGFSSLWDRAFRELKAKDWSIFYPAHILNDEKQTRNSLSLVEPNRLIQCAHFMMFHRDAIPKIIEGLEKIASRSPGHPLGGPMHVDGAYNTIRRQNLDLRTYVNYPSLGYQRSSRSDISDLRFFDRIEMLRPLVGKLRNIKRRILEAKSASD
jgi:glycosyl transferase, family 25